MEKLAISQVPRILEVLNIPEDKHQAILDYAKAHKIPAGAAAIEFSKEHADKSDPLHIGNITQEMADLALLEQGKRKSKAVVEDIAAIAEKGTHAPAKAYWGNNGVNTTAAEPTDFDAIASAGNIGQNIVALVNDNPEMAKNETIVEAARSLSELTHSLAKRTGKLDEQATAEQIAKAKAGLELAVGDTKLTDVKGEPIELKDFIDARFGEIETVVNNRLKAQEMVQDLPQIPQMEAGEATAPNAPVQSTGKPAQTRAGIGPR